MAQQVNGLINQDVNPIYQPSGSLRFCLNGVMEALDGQNGSLMNEEGNELCINFEQLGYVGYQVIGAHRIDTGEILLFMTNGTNSVIGKQMVDCTFELLVNADCLNFQVTKRIHALSRTFNGCERTVYFTDSFNEYRSINIDNLDFYLLPGETVASANASGTGWDCDKIKHFYDYDFPILDLVRVNDTGGSLRLGMYTFSARYIDDNGNATNWIPFSNPIPITQGTIATNLDKFTVEFNSQWQQIQGGINLQEVNGQQVGSIIPTRKSITLEATNLDPNFQNIQFAVIEYTEALKVPTNQYILETVYYAGSSVEYTYRGFNPNIHAAASVDELTIPNLAIDTVHAHAQIENRLFLANVTEFDRKWGAFQRAACQVKSKWVCRADDNFSDLSGALITKRPDYYWDAKSYMRDEIYAFAIVYVFKDGSISPPFHIPGTAADNPDRQALLGTFQANPHNRQNGGTIVDRELLTVVATPASQVALEVAEADVRHLGLSIGDQVERWKVFNTGILTTYTAPYTDGGTFSHSFADGEMAFWECETLTYPEIRDCDGTFVFDVDAWGNTLAGTPVRHHKFPDATLIEHAFTSRTIGPAPAELQQDIDQLVHSRLGIIFDGVSFPPEYAADIQGYYIVRTHRDQFNSHVVDKGLFNNTEIGEIPNQPGDDAHYPPSHNDGFAAGQGPTQDSGREGCLISADSLQGVWDGTDFVLQAPQGDYLKFETVSYANFFNAWNESHFNDVEKPALNHTSRQIVDSVLVASNRVETGAAGFTFPLYNNNWMNDVNYISLQDPVTHLTISAIGDPTQFRRAWYVAVKRNLPDAMGDLTILTYRKFHDNMILAPNTTTGELFGGDVFINNFCYAGYSALGTDDPVPIDTVNPINDLRFGVVALTMWEEKINLSLRHYGDEVYERHPVLKYLSGSGGWRTIPENYAIADMLDPDTDAVERQWKALNPDYHVEASISAFFPLPRTHNWCDNCEGRNPNYIYYSDLSSAFDVVDNYRVFRPLNVDAIFPEDGAISGLFVNRDRLFATTANSVIFLPTKPQTLQGDGTTVFTGTGDVLSAPPKKLVSSDIGYGGCEDKFGLVTNEFGTCIIDSLRGKVFLFDDQLNEISNRGLRNWFRDHGKLQIKKFIKDYPLESLYTNVGGFGFMSVYDPKYRRLIIHKKDYVPVDPTSFGGVLPEVPPIDDMLYYSVEDNGQIRWWRNGVEIFDNNSTYFQNLSWTLSYSYVHKGWASWHSFMPNFMWADSDTFFSYARGLPSDIDGAYHHNYIYADNQVNYQTYYGTKFDHILEFVAKPNIQTGVYQDLEYKSNAFVSIVPFDLIPELYQTFDRVWLYTNSQSSDIMQMQTYNANANDGGFTVYSNDPSSNIMPVRRAEVNWRFNKFRDITVTGNNISTNSKQWFNTSSLFNQVNDYQGYIDRVPEPTSHNPNVSIFDRSRFRDDFMLVRLYTNNQANLKFVTDIFHSFKYPSIR